MTLETEPMYCAEQINIPDNLGEILKAYAKEVIRQQPGNIYEFSARYFAQVRLPPGIPPPIRTPFAPAGQSCICRSFAAVVVTALLPTILFCACSALVEQRARS